MYRSESVFSTTTLLLIALALLPVVCGCRGDATKGSAIDPKVARSTSVGEPADLETRLLKEKGVMPHSPRGSVNVFKEQAEAGDVEAQMRLAVSYYLGAGTDENRAQARKWFALAAEENDKKAQYCLAYMIEHGEGGKTDQREALRMYMKAAEGDDSYAKLAEREVERLSNQFSSAEVAALKKEVIDWYNLSNKRKMRQEKIRRPY